ncbi:MAG: YdbH domain-containing protein [Candidatus Omnitrophica bacterium]|nr:YdbH domain-containing protein [Candidatus Omnitrophota bacterium]
MPHTLKNKRNIFPAFLILFLSFVLALTVLIKPIIIFYVKEQIKKSSGADKITIKDCHLKFLYYIAFDDVQIHKLKEFDISVKEFSVEVDPWRMIIGASPFHFISEARVSNLRLDAQASNFKLDNGNLMINREIPGVLSIDKVQSGNLILSKIRSTVVMDKQEIILQPLSGQIFSGYFDGNVRVAVQQDPPYSAQINFNSLDLADFVDAFNLNEKTKIQGRMAGHLELNGQGKDIRILNGNFSSGNQGGIVVIKDTRFLEHFAGQSNQSSELLMESLRNYHYNTGNLKLSMDQGVALLEINLNGETGKRNFQIRLHDFF